MRLIRQTAAGLPKLPSVRQSLTQHSSWQLKPGLIAIAVGRSEEHTSELQSPCNLVCRLLLEKKKTAVDCLDSADALTDMAIAAGMPERASVFPALGQTTALHSAGAAMQRLAHAMMDRSARHD